MHRVPRYYQKCVRNLPSKPNLQNFTHYGNIFGLGAYFSKPFFALKPWVQAGRFEYHEPHNLSKFFFSPLKGSEPTFKGNSGGLRKLWFGWNFFCELIILFLMGKWFVFNSFWHFNLFGQPYCRGSSLPIELILIPKHYSWKYNTSLHHTYTSSCYMPPI